jgi:hypothetical protein
MLGTILFIDEATGTAIVRADDGKRYRFAASEWPGDAEPLIIGTRIDFDIDGDRAIGPLPVPDALAAVLAKPTTASSTAPVAANPQDDVAEPVSRDPVPADKSTASAPDMAPAVAPADSPSAQQLPTQPADGPPISMNDALDEAKARPGRPISMPQDADIPDYAGLSQPADASGGSGKSLLFVIGGGVLLLALAALAYMMWDNAAGSGETAELSDATVSLFAQQDVPVRNVASMTNSTVLGRIARGDRVTGREVPGSSDPTSRWLQLGDGNRFVPMTGLGPSAPPPVPDPTPLPAPGFTPPPAADGNLDGLPGSLPPETADGDYSASGGPQIVPAPEPPAIRPAPPPVRPAPPSRRPVPESTQPVQPSRPLPGSAPGRDPRDTPPVG